MKRIVIIVLVWLIVVNIFALVGLNRFNLNQDTAYKWMAWSDFSAKPSWNIVELHNRWDSYWYLDIVKNGYYVRDGQYSLANIAFFPVYPALIKIVGTLIGGNFVLAGWLISMAFLFLSAIFLYKLVKVFHPKIDPELPVIFLLAFPTAFFLNVIYTESLFLFISLACFYYCFKKNFLWAGIFGFAGAITHSNGVFLFIPISWEYWRSFGWKINKNSWALITVPIGSAIIPIYHYFKFHNLFLFFQYEGRWGRNFSVNWDHLQFFSHPADVNIFMDIAFTLLAIIATYFIFKKISALYGFYMLGTILSALTSGTMMSMGRYLLALFPIFILLASVKNKLFRQSWLFASVMLLALDIILWVNYYWAG